MKEISPEAFERLLERIDKLTLEEVKIILDRIKTVHPEHFEGED